MANYFVDRYYGHLKSVGEARSLPIRVQNAFRNWSLKITHILRDF